MMTKGGVHRFSAVLATGMAVALWATAWGVQTAEVGASERVEPRVVAATPEEAGRYLVLVGGCNDCHTPGWMEADGRGIPEAGWLRGDSIGWMGPWGTTYARNLRLTASRMTETEWLQRTKVAGGLPPMPWANLRAMNDQDLVAIYRYLRALGPTGAPVPAPVPPGVTPSTPYLSLEPQGLPKAD